MESTGVCERTFLKVKVGSVREREQQDIASLSFLLYKIHIFYISPRLYRADVYITAERIHKSIVEAHLFWGKYLDIQKEIINSSIDVLS